MMRKFLLVPISFFLISVLAFTSPSPVGGSSLHRPFPLTVVDDLGNHVRIAAQPKRILSLDPRDTETLFALGLEKKVVGDGGSAVEGAVGFSRPFRYPLEWPSPWGADYPIRSKELPHVEGGCCGAPWNLETIESLRPDLILSLNSDLESIQKMRDLGFTVIVLDPATLKGVLHDVALVGRATGATKQATVVVRNLRAELAEVKARLTRARGRPRVYYEIDATNPTEPYTAGPGSFIDDAIRASGASNVADAVGTCSGKDCYPQLSLEALVKLDPQIILLGDSAYGTTVASVKSRSGWETMAAVKSGKIYPFDDELISRAGPRIVIGLLKMERLIHPESYR